METYIIFKGMLLGLLISAPVGPVNVLCVQRTLTRGIVFGMVCGLGAATADTMYGMIAAFGVSRLQDFLLSQQLWFRLFGSILVGYWGIKLFQSKPADAEKAFAAKDTGLVSEYFSTFILTLTNPMTIVAFAATFTIFQLVQSVSWWAVFLLVFGVFLGSQLWWCALALGVNLFRDKCSSPSRLRVVNQAAGITLIVIALITLIGAGVSKWFT
jgi:threonine/homoserine/homoserine lactone efflux protein